MGSDGRIRMANRHSALLGWLRDCLAAERSNRGITRVNGQGIKRRRFLEGRDQALSTATGLVDLPPSVAEDLGAAAALYRRECELLHGSWIIAGDAIPTHRSKTRTMNVSPGNVSIHAVFAPDQTGASDPTQMLRA
jgi:hypothetical protein